MTKEIEFNFALWGKENITVETNIFKRLVVTLHENPILDEYYGIAHDGTTFALKAKDLTMYEKVKPREIWVNEIDNRLQSYNHDSKGKAMDAVGYKEGPLSGYVRQIKFIEVID